MKMVNTSARATRGATDPRRANLDWKRILVPLDFSDSSMQALHHAIPLARRSGGTLVLLHVVQFPILPTPVVTGGAVGHMKEAHKALIKNARTQLDRIIRQTCTPGLVTHKVVTVGLAWDEIIKAAKRLKCDLVVVSIHTRRGLPRMLSSHTAEHVVRMASCPVLVVQG
ncbi:MAG: universal stress protein [Verrucomicrobia bacterium]|jgi:nucleotide-binding universal stress UspA family protein|nr:universal stress protein [Verrucomicrobiota bacterium]